MRNKYTKEFEDFVRKNVSKYKKEEFRLLLQDRYNIQLSSDALRRYLNKHHIKGKYIDYKKNNVRDRGKCPVGAEQITKDGVFIKVAQPDKWRRKSRVMYEKYHNCKLDDNDYILFLNGDRNDFSKENLFKSTNQEKCYLHNWGISSKNKELTKTGILSARLYIKAKEVQVEK
jgi:hypothetical protein